MADSFLLHKFLYFLVAIFCAIIGMKNLHWLLKSIFRFYYKISKILKYVRLMSHKIHDSVTTVGVLEYKISSLQLRQYGSTKIIMLIFSPGFSRNFSFDRKNDNLCCLLCTHNSQKKSELVFKNFISWTRFLLTISRNVHLCVPVSPVLYLHSFTRGYIRFAW